jgi:hypothetical protein
LKTRLNLSWSNWGFGIGHINGDVYHMQSEESHIGEASREECEGSEGNF